MKRLRILTLCTVLLSAAIFFLKKRNPTTLASGEGLVIDKAWLIENKTPVTPKEDVRPADQTFLTYPEWYLVFSPEEQANYFKTNTATRFPYMAHTLQIWQSYKIVNDQIKDNFVFNGGYHFMIWVIGTSASVEYSIKAWYETLIGRLTDTGFNKTEEDTFNAVYTQDYVTFIKDHPWYEFDFKSRLKTLWSLDFFGPNFFRKIERKYILTSELLVKTVYGKLIGLGTKGIYDEALPMTAVVIDSLPAENLNIEIKKKYEDGSALLYLPRYDRFNPAVHDLAEKGCSFKEIAGNNSAILVTFLVYGHPKFSFPNAKIVFTQPLASDQEITRIAVTTPVKELHHLLRLTRAAKSLIITEHVFDY